MISQCHLIHEQVLDLQFSNQADAERWQAGAGSAFRQHILPLLDRYLNELCDTETMIRIDTLEINLGELNPQRLFPDFEEKAGRLLKEKLAEAIRMERYANNPEKVITKTHSQIELLRFYLRTASLPWWADARNPGILKDSVEQLLRQQPAALLSLLRDAVEKEAHLKRLIYSLPDRLLALLAALAAGRSPDTPGTNFPDTIHAWTAAFDGGVGIPAQNVRREMWKAIFYGLLPPSNVPDNATQWAIFLELHLQQSLHLSQKAPLRKLCTVLAHWLFPLAVNPTEKKRSSRNTIEPGKEVSEKQQPGDRLTNDLRKNNLENPQSTIKRDTPSAFRHSDELHLSNAGLVLLWPFLTRFFENSGLAKDKAFINEQAPHRAVALLQFSVEGGTEEPEFLLPLNKVLCGLRPDALYEPGPPLRPDEQEATVQFLQAVIGNAPILHNMSVDGFRNTFLQRAGILGVEDDHWLLHVERQTYDVVLERLPWSFNIVKLPWMERPVYVDW